MKKLLKRLLRDKRGAEVTELAIVAAFIIAVSTATIALIGADVLAAFQSLAIQI